MSDETDYLLVDADGTSVGGYGTSCERLETIIRRKAEEFTRYPAKFPTENTIETTLKEDLQNEQKIKITGGYIKDSFNREKEKFGKKLSECTRIPVVQSQINIGYSSCFATDDNDDNNNTWTAINGIGDRKAKKIKKKA